MRKQKQHAMTDRFLKLFKTLTAHVLSSYSLPRVYQFTAEVLKPLKPSKGS